MNILHRFKFVSYLFYDSLIDFYAAFFDKREDLVACGLQLCT